MQFSIDRANHFKFQSLMRSFTSSAVRKKLEIDGEELILEKNQSICVKKGNRVRYSNPFAEP